MFHPFAYARPSTAAEAAQLLAASKSAPLAGGTDLLGCLREGILTPDTVVNLKGLNGRLHGVRDAEGGGLAIGALTTISQIAGHPALRERYPALAQAASEVGSPQLRNQGTIGGNLCQKPRCWYYRGDFHCLRKGGHRCLALGGQDQYHCILGGRSCYIVHPSDPAPALAALGAEVRVTGPEQNRTLAVKDLHMDPGRDPTRETVLEPGEFITEVLLPPLPEGTFSAYRKVRGRRSWDFALAGAALVLEMAGGTVKRARIFLSGAAPVPWRAGEAEQALTGRALTPETIRDAAEASVSGARTLVNNGYKIPLLKGLIREELERAAGQSGA